MKFVLSGDPRVINDILSENRIRVERGWIKFTPLPEEEGDTKDVIFSDEKKPKGTSDKKRVKK